MSIVGGPRFTAGLLAAASAAVALLAAATPAGAQAPPPLSATASKATRGWIDLSIAGRPGTTAEIREIVGAVALPLRTVELASGRTDLARLEQWRCYRRERTFEVRVRRDDGSFETAAARVTTPSCRGRLAVRATPARPRVGRRVTVRAIDRWGTGDLRARWCTAPPGAGRKCGDLYIRPGRKAATLRVAATRAGRWAVRFKVGRGAQTRARFVVRSPGRLRLLATGDSMIQIIDSFLSRRLSAGRRARVSSDAHISTGLSKLSMFNWLTAARRQASRYKPGATVVFIGANDGFPMRAGRRTADCCGDAWVREYARRAERMMRAYLRNGRGRVYWLLLPVPRRQGFAEVYRAVNRAHRRAAAAVGAGVRLIDLPQVFTPGGRFRARMRHRGRVVTVRQGDGVHLNRTGASIAAGLIIRALRRDGLVR